MKSLNKTKVMIIVVLTLIVVGAIVVGYFSIPRIFYENRIIMRLRASW